MSFQKNTPQVRFGLFYDELCVVLQRIILLPACPSSIWINMCVTPSGATRPQMAPSTNTRPSLWMAVARLTSVTSRERLSSLSTWLRTEVTPFSTLVSDLTHKWNISTEEIKGDILSVRNVSPVLCRAECTSGGDEYSRTHYSWLPLQSIWQTGTRE